MMTPRMVLPPWRVIEGLASSGSFLPAVVAGASLFCWRFPVR